MAVGLGYEAFLAIIRGASISRTCCGDCTPGLVDEGGHWAVSPAIEMQVAQLAAAFGTDGCTQNGHKEGILPVGCSRPSTGQRCADGQLSAGSQGRLNDRFGAQSSKPRRWPLSRPTGRCWRKILTGPSNTCRVISRAVVRKLQCRQCDRA